MRCVVVGGGLLGSAVALKLTRRGQEVVVLEKAVVGAEASRAAAGILAPRVEAHGVEPFRAHGLESLASYPDWVGLIEGLSGVEVGFWRCGALVIGADCPDVEALPTNVMPAGLVGTSAWLLEAEATVDPVRLLAAVHGAAERSGARFVVGAEVAEVTAAGVRTADGDLWVGVPIVCAGAWTPRVLPRLPVRPVRGQLAAVRLPPGTLTRVVFAPGGYLVPRRDGTVIVGTTVEEVGFQRGVTVGGLRRVLGVLETVAPGWEAAEVLSTWSGFRPGTPDNLPILGWQDGVYVAAGHYRNGILLAPLTARWVADAVCEDRPAPEAYAPGRFGV